MSEGPARRAPMVAGLLPILLLGLAGVHPWGASATAAPVDQEVLEIAAGTEHELITLKYLQQVIAERGRIQFSGQLTKR